MSTHQLAGVLAPVITPFDARFRPDAERLVAHCRWLLERDVGLSPFGSSSEGNSLSVGEKIDLLEKLVEAGLPPFFYKDLSDDNLYGHARSTIVIIE